MLAANQNTGDVVSFDINNPPGTPGKVVAKVSLAYPDQNGNGPRGVYYLYSEYSFTVLKQVILVSGICWTPDGNFFWVAVQQVYFF